MLTPEQIRRRAENFYEEVLRSIVADYPSLFPLSLLGGRFARPSSFPEDRAAIQALKLESKEEKGVGYSISWVEKSFRNIGTQRVPGDISFETKEDFVRYLGKNDEVRAFEADCRRILDLFPELKSWVAERPKRVLNFLGKWERLLKVCKYLKANPRPGCYLRELPIEPDTKFIETHTAILSEVLPLVAPEALVSPESKRFEERFGFKLKHPLIRIRFLDSALRDVMGFSVSDLALPLDALAAQYFACNVVIVENEMTFLTLPTFPNTLAIFGAGDAAALLGTVAWLRSCPLFYWGDLDVHGFEILSKLRTAFPSAKSLLMCEDVFHAHAQFSVKAAPFRGQIPSNLTAEEQACCEFVQKGGHLLEQERIGLAYSKEVISRSLSGAIQDPSSFLLPTSIGNDLNR